MKKSILFILFNVSCIISFAQTYTLVGSSSQTKTTCNAIFMENTIGSYFTNEDIWMSFKPVGNSYKRIAVHFSQFDVHPSDTLFIYDGNSINATLIGVYNNNLPINLNLPIKASYANTSGNLCFRFKSDTAYTASGWTATVYCFDICQSVNLDIDSLLSIPNPVNNVISTCKSDTISLFASVSFPQNNLYYQQSISGSTFEWHPEPAILKTGQQIMHNYQNNGIKRVYLTFKDNIGCTSYDSVDVVVGAMPVVNVLNPINLCSNEAFMLKAGYLNSVFSFTNLNQIQSKSSIDTTIFIPDGPNCPPGVLSINIPVNIANTSQYINAASDIASICVNIEHSFSGDLGFRIFCPNGQNVILDPNQHSGSNGLGNFFEPDGTPPCSSAANIEGQGWNYCWSETFPNIGTLANKKGSGPSKIDSTNTIANYNYFLPSNPLSALVGCPVNGLWQLQITDDWGADNGYLFNAGINFNPTIISSLPNYQQGINSLQFSSNSSFNQINDSIVIVNNLTPGNHTYNLKISDIKGCVENYQTNINVFEAPVIELGNDTSLCNTDTLWLDATCSNLSNCNYLWNFGSSSPVQLIYLDTIVRTYFVTAQKSYGNFSCYTLDSISVVNSMQAPDAAGNISGNVSVCENSQDVLYYVPPIGNAFQYVWNLNGSQIAAGLDNVLFLDFNNLNNPVLSVYAKNTCGIGAPSILNISTITAPPPPQISQSGNTLISSVASGNQWYLIGYGAIPNATSQQYNLTTTGNYYCLVTSPSSGCISDTSNFINVTSVGINEIEDKAVNLHIAPNPLSNYTVFSYYLIENTIVDLNIYSITGEIIYNLTNMKQLKGNQEIEINANRMNKGLYFYRLKIGNKTYSGKLLRL